jgi:hypothetical protein
VTANDGNLTNRTDVFSTSVQPGSTTAKARARIARATARGRLARLVKEAGAIQGPVRIR